MIVPRYIAGFSGHRHLAGSENIRKALEESLAKLAAKARAVGAVLELFSSITYGADILGVETARKLGLTVHLILPKPIAREGADGAVRRDAGFAADFWEAAGEGRERTFRQEEWERAWRQIQDAEAGVAGGTLRIVHGCHTEPECYYDAGVQILEACDVFLVVWDGQPAQGLGGTGQLVERARADHPPRPLLIIDAVSGGTTEEHLEDFAAENGVQLEKIRHLNALMKEHNPQTAASPAEILARLDDTAKVTSRKFRSSVVKSIYFQGTATLVATVAVILPRALAWTPEALFVLAVLELGLVLGALYLTYFHSRHHTHEQWLRARFGAELARGLRCSAFFLDPLVPQIVRHAPSWRRFAMSISLLALPEGEERRLPWEHWRALYVKDRLVDQTAFFQERLSSAGSQWHRTRAVGRWATMLAPGFVFVALNAKGWFVLHPPPAVAPFSWGALGLDVLVRFMPIVLPMVAATAAGLCAALDITRRSSRYQELTARLLSVQAQLNAMRTGTSARRLVQATEEILLDELIEWQVAERQASGH